jgi:hypothetical protein
MSNNRYYPATPGYNCASGLDTPNMVGIDNALNAYIASQT